jgi:Tfp pilus assembly protein PilF
MLSLLLGAVATMIGFAFWQTVRTRRTATPDLVVVLPFSVNARDSSVANIGIHMMDLLRAVLPRAVVRPEWIRVPDDDEKLRLARDQGASMMVIGNINETPQRTIRVTAHLVDVRTGRGLTPATAQGSPDDYLLLADTVANRLLGQLAGEQQRTYLFRDQPASAVRAYLDGRIAYRAGRYAEAAALFEQALDSSTVNGSESTFGLAASSLVEASNYLQVRNEAGEHGLKLAWKAREQLNARDRAYLLAEAGPVFPKIATRRATLEAWSRAVEEQQDYPEAFYFFGDLLAQFGPFVQWEGFDQLARNSLSRALKIDSTFVPARQRLAELLLDHGDHATARQLAARLIDDSTADLAGFLRWRLAIARNDQGALAELRKRFGTMSDASARRIWLTAQLEGRALEDAHRALQNMQANAVGADELASLAAARYVLAMNEGRPRAALEDLYRAFPTDELYYLPVMQGQIIRDAIFGSGLSVAAESAAAQIASVLTDAGTNRNPTRNDLAAEYVQRCALEQWRLHRGNADSAQATLRRLGAIVPVIDTLRLGGTTTVVIGAQPLCPAILEAWAADLRKLPDAHRSLDRLDSLMMQGPMDLDAAIGNLLVARLRVEHGDTTAALRALRRRPRAVAGLIYLAPALREEGILAVSVGDREGALRALEHYVALRSAPEHSLREEKERVEKMLDLLRSQTVANRRDTNPVRAK